MNVMHCYYRRIPLSLLPVFFLSLTGCLGNFGNSMSQYKFSTNVTVIAPVTSVTEGQPVTLEADISGGANASGTVTFYNGSNAIGTAQVSSPYFYFSLDGGAQLSTTFSSSGVQSITAKYSGDEFNASSTSQPISIGVYSNQLITSSLTLQASTTTPQYLTNVMLTATVTPTAATGTVTFYNGTTNLGIAAVSGGTASLSTSFTAGGAYTLHAVYSGDYNYLSSTSNSLTMNVSGPLVTSTSLQASTSATAIGDSVTLTANLTPATVTGTVTFYNGSTAIGTANVNAGVAALNTTFAASGKITLKAIFAGNTSWETSTSNQVPLFVTGITPDTVLLQAVPSSLVIGDFATLTASVSPAGATGTVVFYDGASAIGNCTIVGGMCTNVSYFMAAGSQSLTAVYSGDTTYISGTSNPVTLQVSNPGSTPTLTALELSEYTGYSGDAVTLTAIVNPPAATGQIDFYDNGNLLHSVVLTSGKAAWAQFFTQAGQHNITAVYDGDTTYSSSTSSTQVLVLYDNSD
jgi:hypothetical protein